MNMRRSLLLFLIVAVIFLTPSAGLITLAVPDVSPDDSSLSLPNSPLIAKRGFEPFSISAILVRQHIVSSLAIESLISEKNRLGTSLSHGDNTQARAPPPPHSFLTIS